MTSERKKMPDLEVCPRTPQVKVYFQFLEKEIVEHFSWLQRFTCYFKHTLYMHAYDTFSKAKRNEVHIL